VLSVRASEHRKRLIVLILGVVAAAATVPRFVPQNDLQRAVQALAHGVGASSNGRAALWAEAWRVFSDHPWAGIGTGGFAALEPLLRYPHNFILELAAECGALGLGLAVVAVCSAAARGLRLWANGESEDRVAACFVCAFLVAAVVNGCLSGDLPINASIWTAMGLACAAAARARLGARG
jgi:O-antigen ligase